MSESEDSKEVDKIVSSPKSRFSTLFHPNLDDVNLIALQEVVRNQKLHKGEVILMKTDFDAETENTSSDKIQETDQLKDKKEIVGTHGETDNMLKSDETQEYDKIKNNRGSGK